MAKHFKERPLVFGITPDGDSMDRDDATWIEQDKDGIIHLYISIADTSYFIEKESFYEKQSKKMLETVYHVDGIKHNNINMLGDEFAENKISLLPNAEKPAITVHSNFDPNFIFLNFEINQSRLIVKGHYSQNEFSKELASNSDFKLWAQLAYQIQHNILDSPKFSPFAPPKPREEYTEGVIAGCDKFIECLMLYTNMLASCYMIKNKIPAMYRNHFAPNNKDHYSDQVYAFAKSLTAGNKILDFDVLSIKQRANATRAFYSAEAMSHSAVAHKPYQHFTSPIRRRPDLINHANLTAFLEEKPYPYSKAEITEDAHRYNIKRANEKKSHQDKEVDTTIQKFTELLFDAEETNRLSVGSHKDYEYYAYIAFEEGIESEVLKENLMNHLNPNAIHTVSDRLLLTIAHLMPRKSNFWSPVKEAFVNYVENKPMTGITLLHMSCLTHKDWSDYRVRDKEINGLYGKQICIRYKGESMSAPETTLQENRSRKLNVREFWQAYMDGKLRDDRGTDFVAYNNGEQILRQRAGLWQGTTAETFLGALMSETGRKYHCIWGQDDQEGYLAFYRVNVSDVTKMDGDWMVKRAPSSRPTAAAAKRAAAYDILKVLRRKKCIPEEVWQNVANNIADRTDSYKNLRINNNNQPS